LSFFDAGGANWLTLVRREEERLKRQKIRILKGKAKSKGDHRRTKIQIKD